MYLRNEVMDAAAVLRLGLIDEVVVGVRAAQSRALSLARMAAGSGTCPPHRQSLSCEHLCEEATRHAQCLVENRGMRPPIDASHSGIAPGPMMSFVPDDAVEPGIVAAHDLWRPLRPAEACVESRRTARRQITMPQLWARVWGNGEPGVPLQQRASQGALFANESKSIIQLQVHLQADGDLANGLFEVASSSLSPSSRAVVVQMDEALAPHTATSRYAHARVAACIARVREAFEGPLIFTVDGVLSGLDLYACLRADYVIVSTRATVVCRPREAHFLAEALTDRLGASSAAAVLTSRAPINAGAALSLGVVSEVSACPHERGLSFAHWLALHPSNGLRGTLHLSRPTDVVRRRALALEDTEAKHSWLTHPGSSAEARLDLQVQLARCESRSVSPSRRARLAEHGSLPGTKQELLANEPDRVVHRDADSLTVGVHAMAISAGGSAGNLDRCTKLGHQQSTCRVALALDATSRLVERTGVAWRDLGYVEVATGAPLLDRSKSLKTELCLLLESHGCADAEAVDAIDAEGMTSLLNASRWVQSAAWDGRWAIVVSVGSAHADGHVLAVAVLVGSAGPLRISATASCDEHDWSNVAVNDRHQDDKCQSHETRVMQLFKQCSDAMADAHGIMLPELAHDRLLPPALTSSAPGASTLVELALVLPDMFPGQSLLLCSRGPASVHMATMRLYGDVPILLGDREGGARLLRGARSPSEIDAVAFTLVSSTKHGRRAYARKPLHVIASSEPEEKDTIQSKPRSHPVEARIVPDGNAAVLAALTTVLMDMLPGVAMDAPLMDSGLDSLGIVEFRNRLSEALSMDIAETVVFSFPTVRLLEAHLQAEMDRLRPTALALQTANVSTSSQSAEPVESHDVRAVLDSVLAELVPGISADAPLMEGGLDSLGTVELRNQLSARLGNLHLPEMIVFDHPTVRQLEGHLRELRPEARQAAPAVRTPHAVSTPSAVAAASPRVVGSSPMLPSVIGAAEAYRMACSGTDVVGEVPVGRWAIPDPCDPVDPVLQRQRHGGFLECDFFDNAFFGVSTAEAATMDPQQRLLLERGYTALHEASMQRASLFGSLCGVFVGIGSVDWQAILADAPSGGGVYAATGSSHSIAAGRLSFFLGLQGPAVAIDTACSSALVAAHGAVRALQQREMTSGLVVGVNLMLTPNNSSSFALAGMTSATGRCHTFDSRANGYARAEACCAIALTDNGESLVVLGSSVRQDGRSATLTAPNGLAQQALLGAAVHDAAIGAQEVSVLEAHGTGTALGDPVEMRALTLALLHGQELAVGSAKANCGHAEPGAGGASLVRMVSGLRNGVAAPNAQLRMLNAHLRTRSESSCVVLPVGPTRISSPCGGASSFGYNGTIAHVLLRRSPIRTTAMDERDEPDFVPAHAPAEPEPLNDVVEAADASFRDAFIQSRKVRVRYAIIGCAASRARPIRTSRALSQAPPAPHAPSAQAGLCHTHLRDRARRKAAARRRAYLLRLLVHLTPDPKPSPFSAALDKPGCSFLMRVWLPGEAAWRSWTSRLPSAAIG